MSFFNDQVRKHRGLPAGNFIVRSYTFCDIQLFEQVALQALSPMARGHCVVRGDGEVEP